MQYLEETKKIQFQKYENGKMWDNVNETKKKHNRTSIHSGISFKNH